MGRQTPGRYTPGRQTLGRPIGEPAMHKILVAADGSKHSLKAVGYLITHREQFGSQPEIQLMHVRAALPARAASALGRKAVTEHYEEETRKALAPAMRALDK